MSHELHAVEKATYTYGRRVAKVLLDVLEGKCLMGNLNNMIQMYGDAEDLRDLDRRVRALRLRLGTDPEQKKDAGALSLPL